MKIFITGGCGFIGSNFIDWLLKNTGHDIVCFDDLSTGFESNIPLDNPRLVFVRASIVKQNDVENAFSYFKPDLCYHFAAYAAEGRSNSIRTFNHFNNTVGSSVVINACVNYKVPIVFSSSVAVYSGLPPFNEKTIPDPIDEYGLSKLTTEKSLEIAARNQGLRYTIVRPRNVYGERQSLWDEARNVFGIWMNQIINDKPMTIFGTGNNKRCFTYIGDILNPLMIAGKHALTSNRNLTVNIGSGTPYRIIDAAMVLQKITGYNKTEHLPERHEVKEAICQTELQKIFLEYENETSLFDGLTKMWRWAQHQPQRAMTKMPELEIK